MPTPLTSIGASPPGPQRPPDGTPAVASARGGPPAQAPLRVPGTQRDPGSREVAVDQDALAGWDPAQLVGRREPAIGGGRRAGAPAVAEIRRPRLLAHRTLAGEAG